MRITSMRIAFISDIHGNLTALDSVLEDIDAKSESVDEIVCLGDIVDLGPQPKECIQCLQSRRIPCIQGNHDPMTDVPKGPPMLKAIYDSTLAMLDADDRKYLNGLPATLRIPLTDNKDDTSQPRLYVLCVHGSPRSYLEGITSKLSDEELNEMMIPSPDNSDGKEQQQSVDFDVLVCGHTHVQLLRRWRDPYAEAGNDEGKTVINVGSVGFPFQYAVPHGNQPKLNPWAEYVIIESEGRPESLKVEFCRVAYDVEKYRQACLKAFGKIQGTVFL